MSLETIALEEKQNALIVSHIKHPLVDQLKAELEHYGMQVYFSPHIPPSLGRFQIAFLVNQEPHLKKNDKHTKNVIYIFINKHIQDNPHYPKIITVSGDEVAKKDIERLLWFTLSHSKERFLAMHLPKKTKHIPNISHKKYLFPFHFTGKKIFISIFFLFILLHVLFLLPLGISGYFNYRSAQSLMSERLEDAIRLSKKSIPFQLLAEKLYKPVRPTYLFFSAAIHIDSLFAINEKAHSVIEQSLGLITEAKRASYLVLNKNKSPAEQAEIKQIFQVMRQQLSNIEDSMRIINQKIPENLFFTKKTKVLLSESMDSLSKANKLLPIFTKILSSEKEQKYLLLFANNMELRPGGGFIGSFAVLNLGNYTLGNFEVYDVYDADGQLTAHVEPPAAIREHLNQPHFFLRDSAFYPDFADVYTQAEFFLEKEMGFTTFAGGALITTTSVEHLLEAFDEVYLPDYREKVNAKNFYIKAQIYSEKEFFPGSIQKKSFLAALTRQLMVEADTASPRLLVQALKKSADEKQVVFFFRDPELEKEMNTLYWSGRVIEPTCTAPIDNCIVDYLFPIDANLGVNKANFYLSRTFNLFLTIDANGALKHTFTALYKNDSPGDIFPGGTYKNYFQLMIPTDTVIDSITLNGVAVENYTETNLTYHTIGFLASVPPRSTSEIKISYHTNHPFKKGRGILQLITQKQIGAKSNELNLSIDLPTNMYLLNQNFTPLVNGGNIRYNTVLSTDKIFFIELTRE